MKLSEIIILYFFLATLGSLGTLLVFLTLYFLYPEKRYDFKGNEVSNWYKFKRIMYWTWLPVILIWRFLMWLNSKKVEHAKPHLDKNGNYIDDAHNPKQTTYKKIMERNTEIFIEKLEERGYTHHITTDDRVVVTYDGTVNLGATLSIPNKVTFKNKGNVHLQALEKLPDSVIFNNTGYVDIRGLKEKPNYLVHIDSHPDNIYIKPEMDPR